MVTFAGGIAGGAGAVSGAVDVGVLRNNVNAEIKTGARVGAKDSVHVNAMGIKEIDSIAASGALGLVGLTGAVSVWTVGTALSSNYEGDGGAPANALEKRAVATPLMPARLNPARAQETIWSTC